MGIMQRLQASAVAMQYVAEGHGIDAAIKVHCAVGAYQLMADEEKDQLTMAMQQAFYQQRKLNERNA